MGDLEAQIQRLRALPRVEEEILPEVARELEQIIAGNIAAQRGPDGEPWQKSDEGPVLLGAMKNIKVSVVGRVVLIRVSGPEARHHKGAIRGKVQRRLIPTAKIPQAMTEAIRRVADRKIKEAVRGE